MNCPQCDQTLPANANFCPACRAEVPAEPNQIKIEQKAGNVHGKMIGAEIQQLINRFNNLTIKQEIDTVETSGVVTGLVVGANSGTEEIQLDVSDPSKILETLERRLQIFKEQKAYKGINTDPEIIMEIEDIEKEIAKIKQMIKNGGQ